MQAGIAGPVLVSEYAGAVICAARGSGCDSVIDSNVARPACRANCVNVAIPLKEEISGHNVAQPACLLVGEAHPGRSVPRSCAERIGNYGIGSFRRCTEIAASIKHRPGVPGQTE